MESLEIYFDRADYLIQESEQVPCPEPKNTIPCSKWRSFRMKIRESYAKSLTKVLPENIRPTSRILDDLLTDLEGTRIVVNLFPADDGYSVTLMKSDGNCAENLTMPYDEDEILDYIDNEQLPPILVDALHKNHCNTFICGALLAEIRDYRISADEYSYETRYVLLKPTAQTLTNDVNIIAEETSGSYKWAVDDKLALESALTLATAEPLCLDTSPMVVIVKNKLQARKNRFKTRPMKKMIKRNGVLLRKRAQVLGSRSAPSSLKLFDFLLERKRHQKDHSSSLSPDVKLPQHVVDVWRKTPLVLLQPSKIDAAQYAAVIAPPADSIKNEDIFEVQSIVIESEGAVSCITIGQRPRDMHYFGMLQSNKYKPNTMDIKDMNQVFSLGTETRANLYILQYQELFTEDGRRPAKVTLHYVHKPSVVYHIPNQQQPWQLEQEKSMYAVESVRSIPASKWKKMSISSYADLRRKNQQQHYNTNGALLQKQKLLLKQQPTVVADNSSQLPAKTPTLNVVTSQNSSTVFNFQGNLLSGQRLMKTKSNPCPEALPIARQPRLSNDNLQVRTQPGIPVPEGSRVLLTRNGSNGNNQTFTVNSSAIATALGQISVQLPVMAVSSQRGTDGFQDQQTQGQPATAVIRMPVGIAGGTSSSGQLTASLNLISGGQNVLGNIQLGGGGSIAIPASQLPPTIAMQLTSRPNTQQISLVSGLSGTSLNTQPQGSVVSQSGSTAPFTIISNNDNWQNRDRIIVNPQTYTIAPRMQILPSTSRTIPGQQSQQVQLRICNPAHIVSAAGSNDQRIQLVAARPPLTNVKKRMTPD